MNLEMKHKIDVEARAQQAREFFESGYNCSQAVTMTYADICELPREVLERVGLAFGGGLGRQREVCGTVSGGSMVLGTVESLRSAETAKMSAYKHIQLFSDRFRAANGSIVCRELLALGKGENADPTPTPRTPEYYRRRPCGDYVAISARLVGELLNETAE